MSWFSKIVTLPLFTKLAITAVIFLIGLRFGAIVLIFLPFVFFPLRKHH